MEQPFRMVWDHLGSFFLLDVPVLFPRSARSQSTIKRQNSRGLLYRIPDEYQDRTPEPIGSVNRPGFCLRRGLPERERERDSKTTSATTEVQWNYERLVRRAGPSGACVFVYIFDRTVSSYAGENVPPPYPSRRQRAADVLFYGCDQGHVDGERCEFTFPRRGSGSSLLRNIDLNVQGAPLERLKRRIGTATRPLPVPNRWDSLGEWRSKGAREGRRGQVEP
jgi:hypothetical protein